MNFPDYIKYLTSDVKKGMNMKMKKKIIILTALVLAVTTLLCSCGAPNTVSTDTKYENAFITSLYAKTKDAEINEKATFTLSNETVSGCAWNAVKALGSYKYYTPAEAKGDDKTSYSAAFTNAAKKQFELAAAGGAKIIVVSGEEYADAYLGIKDTTKTFGDVTFVLLTVVGSDLAKEENLNAKTTAVVLDNSQLGYLFGYYAAEKGFKKIGYAGADTKASAAFLTGLKAGAEAFGGAEVVSSLTSSGPVENIINEDIDKIKDADILIGDELTVPYIASSGKKYASIYKDEKAEFYITVNSEKLTAKIAEMITSAKQSNKGTVKHLSVSDGIFVYSGSDTLVEVPDFIDAYTETTETTAESTDTTAA